MDQVDQFVGGDRSHGSGGLAEGRGGDDAIRIARAVAGRQFGVGAATETLAEQFTEKLLHVEDAVLRQLPAPPNELGVEDEGVERLLREGHVHAAVVGQGAGFSVLGNRRGGVIHSRDLDRVSRGRVDRGADVVVVHRAPGGHRLDDEAGQFGGDGEAASGGRAAGLGAEFSALLDAATENGTVLRGQFRQVAAGTKHRVEGFAVFRGLAALVAAARFAVADRALLGADFLSALLDAFQLLAALDQAVETVELGHRLVVRGFQFGGAAFVGVRLDQVQALARFGHDFALRVAQFFDVHRVVPSMGGAASSDAAVGVNRLWEAYLWSEDPGQPSSGADEPPH